MPTIALIEKKLTDVFHPTHLIVQDDSAEHAGHAHEGSGHFTVTISAEIFKGKWVVKQHRLIYDALGTLMQTHIHALKIKIVLSREC